MAIAAGFNYRGHTWSDPFQ